MDDSRNSKHMGLHVHIATAERERECDAQCKLLHDTVSVASSNMVACKQHTASKELLACCGALGVMSMLLLQLRKAEAPFEWEQLRS